MIGAENIDRIIALPSVDRDIRAPIDDRIISVARKDRRAVPSVDDRVIAARCKHNPISLIVDENVGRRIRAANVDRLANRLLQTHRPTPHTHQHICSRRQRLVSRTIGQHERTVGSKTVNEIIAVARAVLNHLIGSACVDGVIALATVDRYPRSPIDDRIIAARTVDRRIVVVILDETRGIASAARVERRKLFRHVTKHEITRGVGRRIDIAERIYVVDTRGQNVGYVRRIFGKLFNIAITIIVDAMSKLRHALFDVSGQSMEVVDGRRHDRVGELMRKGAVKVTCGLEGALAVDVIRRDGTVVSSVDGQRDIVGGIFVNVAACYECECRTCVGEVDGDGLGSRFDIALIEGELAAVTLLNEIERSLRPPRVETSEDLLLSSVERIEIVLEHEGNAVDGEGIAAEVLHGAMLFDDRLCGFDFGTARVPTDDRSRIRIVENDPAIVLEKIIGAMVSSVEGHLSDEGVGS